MAKKKTGAFDPGKADAEKAIQLAVDSLTKQFGVGTVIRSSADFPDIDFISSQSIKLDWAMNGGFARGRIVEIYGPESCLAANTFIEYEIRSKDGKRIVNEFTSIEKLFYHFNYASIDSEFYAFSVDSRGCIIHNKIMAVMDTGVKDCFQLETTGETIQASADHKFFTGEGYVPLSDLQEGDQIMIQNDTIATPTRVEKIYSVGQKHTYDIRMESPFNNYVAERFIVHNSGKTTMALHVIAEAQKRGLTCGFIDVEHALDMNYAKALGVIAPEETNGLIISQPDCAEEALQVLDTFIRTKAFSVIVLDSVAALTPRAELEGDMGDSHVGLHARLMSQALRKITSITEKTNTLVIFINQIRMKIGVMFGSPETTSGGNALKFYASQRLDIRRIGTLKEGEDKVGVQTKVKVVKNKVGWPFREVLFNIKFGKGIDSIQEIVDLSTAHGFVEKSGAWFVLGDEKIQGEPNFIEYLSQNNALKEELKKKILELPQYSTKKGPEDDDTDESDLSSGLGDDGIGSNEG